MWSLEILFFHHWSDSALKNFLQNKIQGKNFVAGREIKLIRFLGSGLHSQDGNSRHTIVGPQLPERDPSLPYLGNSYYKGYNMDLESEKSGLNSSSVLYKLGGLNLFVWHPKSQFPIPQNWKNNSNFRKRWISSKTSSENHDSWYSYLLSSPFPLAGPIYEVRRQIRTSWSSNRGRLLVKISPAYSCGPLFWNFPFSLAIKTLFRG